MNVDFAFICDYAEVTGKINAMGIGFDTIYAPQVPYKHPHFFLVVQLRTSVTEAGEKNLEVDIIDEDGTDVIPKLKGKFNIPQKGAGPERIGRLAMEFNNVEFPKYGTYSLHAVVEGHEMVRVPLKVSLPPRAV
ncbi:MAG: hypothetical protein Q8P44_06900 [Dehalococcoidia bacterium]|nr:hypothetical protein [Dehalococcoidia bacterium]